MLGDIRATDFGTSDVKRYIAHRRRQKASNASINRELAILMRIPAKLNAQSEGKPNGISGMIPNTIGA